MRKVTAASVLLLCCAAAATLPLAAQAYPSRPIRFISPYPPGGGNDTLSRILADKLGEGLGQRVIVDNRPGANTIVGTEITAKSPPDGHTVILLPTSFVTNPSFYRKLPYDTVRDFAPVALIALSPQILVAHPSMPASHRQGVPRARQGEARPFQLLQRGARFGRSSGGPALHHDDRHRPRARRVQGNGPGAHRSSRRPRAVDVFIHADDAAARARREAAHPTDSRRPSARPRFPRCPPSRKRECRATNPRLWYGVLAPGKPRRRSCSV